MTLSARTFGWLNQRPKLVRLKNINTSKGEIGEWPGLAEFTQSYRRPKRARIAHLPGLEYERECLR